MMRIIYEKLDSLFIWTVLATLLGAFWVGLFFDWNISRNHLLEIFFTFRFTPTFEFTGYQD
jgi:hypothetical protein